MRSSNRLSWVLAIVGILLVIVFLMLQKRQFKWETNYSTYSDEPFGCQLFDSIMSSSCTQGYEVVDTRIDSILLSPKWKRHLVMEICDLAELNLTPKLVLDFVRDGGVFLLASEYWNAEFVWSLNASFKRDDSNIHIGQPVEGEFQQVVFKQSPTYPEHTYTLSSSLCDYYLTPSDPADTVLFTKDIIKAKKYNLKWSDHVFLKTSQKPVVSTASYGKGQIILCSMPMLFTNYGIMESDNFGLIMRIVSLAGKKKIVRTDETHRFELPNIENPIQEGETPIMDHILNNQALQTAFYLALAGLLIFTLLWGLQGGISVQSFYALWASELFPARYRAAAQGVMFFVVRGLSAAWGLGFVYIYGEQGEGFSVAAYVMLALLLISLIIGTVGAPNTRGKSLDEISKERGFSKM